MSDESQGDGWWLASDGKWYPPESAPAPVPPPPPTAPPGGTPWGSGPGGPVFAPPSVRMSAPHAPTRRFLSSGLSGTLQGFLWAAGAVAAISATLAFATLIAFNDWWNAPVGSRAEERRLSDWRDVEDALAAASGFFVLLSIVVFVLMIVWMNQAHKVTQQLWSGNRAWSSGWTVGGWFIPLGNLVIPKLVVTEIERIAVAARSGGQVGSGWRTAPTAVVGWLWWVAWVIGIICNAVGNTLGDDLDSSASEVRAGYVLNGAGLALVAFSAVCAVFYVRRISARLSADGLPVEP